MRSVLVISTLDLGVRMGYPILSLRDAISIKTRETRTRLVIIVESSANTAASHPNSDQCVDLADKVCCHHDWLPSLNWSVPFSGPLAARTF